MNAHVSDAGRVPAVPQGTAGGKAPSQKPKAPARARSAVWLVAGLLILSVLPLIFGVLRLIQLAGGAAIMPAPARLDASPLPVVVHIVSAAVYGPLGAFQFAPGVRRRYPGWHRVAGRLLVPCGLAVALSGLWMTLVYPTLPGTGALLYAFRLVFGSAMVVSIVLGYTTIRRGELTRHRAWMTRGYALGLGASTQMLTGIVGEMIAVPQSALSHDLLKGAGWVINLLVAEWAIRRRRRRLPAEQVRTAAAGVSQLH